MHIRKVQQSLICRLEKEEQTGKILIDKVDYVPVYCYDKGANSENRYELIDMRHTIGEYENGNTEGISVNLYKTLKTELQNTVSVLGEPIISEDEKKEK